jgi:hypothetical protein
MKPDWQNKSYAKTSSPTAPSTTHAKLKLGMSSLHGKISAANSNMPKTPKPMVRKFADGGSVRTRSDDEIGDTNPRTGVVDPGSYDRRMKAGAENLARLNSAVESVRSFFSREKGGEASPSNISGDSGMSDSDTAKKQAMSGGMDFEKKAEPVAEVKAEEPVAKTEEPSYKQDVVKAITQPKATVQDLAPAASSNAAPAAAASSNTAVVKKAAAPVVAAVNKKKPAKVDRSNRAGKSQKDIEALIAKKVTDTGDETNRLRDRTSKFVPGFGQIDNQGNIIPGVRGGLKKSQVYSGTGKEDSFMDRAEKKYLQSRIDAGNLTAMERAQAKRAGLL